MRIAIYVRPFAPMLGGMERISEILAREFTLQGHETTVFTEALAPVGFDLLSPFKVRRGSSVVNLWRGFRNSDVILFMGVSLRGLPVALLSNRTIVLSHHGVYEGTDLRSRYLGGFKKWLTRFFHNISVSSYVAARLPAHSVVIHNAYDQEAFKYNYECKKDRDFVFCGRLVSDKGVKQLLEAFSKVRESLVSVNLTIIGEGGERKKLEELASRLCAGHVTFTGPLCGPDLALEIGRHKCMVVPSLCEESFGIVALEGLACGCKVVVANRGGLPEAVGEFGTIVEPEAVTLAQAMLKIIREADGHSGGDGSLCSYLALHSTHCVASKYITTMSQFADKF